jgi:pSer/pThr/pTyr-binding forkhead associated (FHA) protein
MAALIQFASGAPGIKYALDKREILIGRQSLGNDICLPCSYVSKSHARIQAVSTPRGDGFDFYIEDLGSTNHTFVNDEPIKRVKLLHDDLIRIGRNTLKFDALSEAAVLEAVELSEDEQDDDNHTSTEGRTWNFSRRLRLLGIDA